MSSRPVSDDALRERYARLLAARAAASGVPDVPVETVEALAAGTYAGADRIALLDRVLSHPVTARELQFFSALAAEAPAPARAGRPVLWALAAMVVVAAGIALIRRGDGGDDVLRGDRDGFVLLEPGADAVMTQGTRFVWRAAAGAERYRLELVNAEGTPVLTVGTTDTTALLSGGLAPGDYQARIVALLRDGTEARTSATRIRVP